jgi:DNA (cytosine-5)-methyltransferase 1
MIRFVDLFAGIGGFHLAATAAIGAHAKCVGWCEIDPKCRALYRAAFEGAGVALDDVRGIAAGRSGDTRLPDFDLLLAGFPCQSFSNIGKRSGLNDSRGELFFEIVRLLEEYRPKLFVLENVQKLVTIQRGAVLEEMRRRLSAAGYAVAVWDLVASDYGVPQQRRRLFFVGQRSQRVSNSLREASPPPMIPRANWRFPTAWHLLEPRMDPIHLIPNGTRGTVLRRNPKWMGELQIDRAIARPLTASMSKWHRANQDNYYSATYVFEGGAAPERAPVVDWATEPIRRITPLEGFRLQGFPDRFAAIAANQSIALSSQYRMIGNAVPVTLAQSVIAQAIRIAD